MTPVLFEVQPRQPAQDHVAARTGVAQHAEHLGLELLDLGALDDRPAFALHAGADVVDVPVLIRIRRSLRVLIQKAQRGDQCHAKENAEDKRSRGRGRVDESVSC